jgi:hypothetical protein
MSRAARATLALCLAASGFGCAAVSTDATVAKVDVAGAWSYLASSSQNATTSGTLALAQDRTVQFSGTFDASEQDAGGVHRIVGVVSGRTLDATAVDFDVLLDATRSRHHSGTVRGDSLAGSWVELTDRGVIASGSFRARRVRTQ